MVNAETKGTPSKTKQKTPYGNIVKFLQCFKTWITHQTAYIVVSVNPKISNVNLWAYIL
jgi:hypothetical protein